MQLLIVESPRKAKTLSSFLGKDYLIRSSLGHVRDLPKTTLGVDVEHGFTPTYVIPPAARKTVNALKKEVAKAEHIILSTDADREGEAIAWHLTEVLGLKNPERIVFHEITKQAIEEALKNPRRIDRHLVNAQQARRVLDRLVGYKLSPFLWKKVARGLSAGRVQSAAVRLMAEREQEIRSFVPKEYWTIVASLIKTGNQNKKSKNEFDALLAKKDGKPIGKFDIPDKKTAENILKDLEGASWQVESLEQKEVKRNPLPPFTTSTLQQTAWQRLRFPAKLTMAVAQHLYETGIITYHRTDSFNLSLSALDAAKKYILKTYGKDYWPGFSRTFRTKSKLAQEAHEAIRPTDPFLHHSAAAFARSSGAKLYNLIWSRFLASQMSPALFHSTAVHIQAKGRKLEAGSRNYTFHASGQILRFDGFLKTYPIKFEETELPLLEKGENLILKKLTPNQHFTQPPPRYTEATLVKALEEYGIGRPSTYAPILTTVQERGYVAKDEQKRLYPTDLGMTVNDLLVKHFQEIVDIAFTAGMEQKLDDIARGKTEWMPMIRAFYEPFEKNLQHKYGEVSKKEVVEETTDRKCPKCESPAVIRLGRFGKFYACSTFPKCSYTESLETKNAPIGMVCPTCNKGQIMTKRTKRGKVFYGCDRYPACDFACWQNPKNEVK